MSRVTGVAIGLVIGLIIAAFLLKFANSNHKMKTEYDERQQVIRGRGYMYGFYAFLAYEVVMMVISMGDAALPIPDSILHFGGVCLSATVLGVHSIWNDVYWGLNSNRKRYGIVFAFIGLLNLIPVIGAFRSGELIVDGVLDIPFLNIMVLIMMLVLGLALLMKRAVGTQEDDA